MKRPALRRPYRPLLESLEQRLNLTPTPIGTVTLPGANTVGDSLVQHQAAPIFADVDGDTRDEVIVSGGNGNLYAYELGTDSAIVQKREYSLGSLPSRIHSTPVVVGVPRSIAASRRAIFVAAENGQVFGFDGGSGAVLNGWPVSIENPQHGAPQSGIAIGALAAGDLDRDGFPEIVVTALNHEVTALRTRDARVLWRFSNDETVFGAAAIGDLDRDGLLEVVVGGNSSASTAYAEGGRINCLSWDGRRKWVKATDQAIQSSPVLADLNSTGFLNVIVGTGLVHPLPHGNVVYALDHLGNDLPGWPYVTATAEAEGRSYSSPAIADLNNDGVLDIVLSDVGQRLHAIDRNGQALPGWPIQAFASTPGQELYASPIVADIDDTASASDQLHVVLPTNGLIRGFDPQGNQIWEFRDDLPHFTAATVGQLRTDGSWQLALTANGFNGAVLSPSFLAIFDLGTTTIRPPWPQFRQKGGNHAVARPDGYSTTLVTQIYVNALGRTPTQEELDNVRLPELRHAPSLRPGIAALLSSSDARTRKIDGWYRLYLGRGVDAAGLNSRLAALASGQSYAALQAALAASDRAFSNAGRNNQRWVEFLYKKVLGRAPRNGEEADWVRRLNLKGQIDPRALTRLEVANALLRSREFTERQVRAWYTAYAGLGIQPVAVDSLTAAGWHLRRGRLEEDVLADLLTSNGNYVEVHTEASWIKALYRDALHRPANPTDIAGRLRSLEAGVRQDVLARAIHTSREANTATLIEVYGKLLRRTPTSAEITPFVNRLNAGQRLTSILGEILAGDEYFTRSGSNNTTFIGNAYQDILDRPATQVDFDRWNAEIARGQNIRTLLPRSLLASREYFTHVLDLWYFKYLRRFPNTPADLGRVILQRSPYKAQGFLNSLVAKADPRDILTSILRSPEYISLARAKAFYTGTGRWLDATRP